MGGDVVVKLSGGSRLTLPAKAAEKVRALGREVAVQLYPREVVRALWPEMSHAG